MTVGTLLSSATKRLQAVGIPTARLDVLVLMEDALNTDRTQILANPDLSLMPAQQKRLAIQIRRRAAHEPLAHIRNRTEFYGREFYINRYVLQPRSESETMIDLLKSLPAAGSANIIDVGTGSGALAITAKLELPRASVLGLDIDKRCLAVATENARQLGTDVQFLQSDLLASPWLPNLASAILLCNLPYVPDDFRINLAATHEPRHAIFGGHDGLNLYRRLFEQLAGSASKPSYALTEALPPQHLALQELAEKSGYVLKQAEDFIQVFQNGN